MRVYIETYGCTANFSDSERIASFLLSRGVELTTTPESADVIIVNTCAVKSHTEFHMRTRISHLLKINSSAAIFVTGCLVHVHPDPIAALSDRVIIIPLHDVHLLASKLGIRPPDSDFFELDWNYRFNKIIAPIVISEGCLGHCTYCATKLARGELKSVPISIIVRAVRSAIKQGAREIQLTSQDTGIYGVDIGVTLYDLLYDILNSVDGDYRIRLGMTNPTGLYMHGEGYSKRLFNLFQDSRIYRFLHIPVQSGSDSILKDMRRQYTVAQFERIVAEARKYIRDLVLSTDIIVGYPTETDSDFQQTVSLIERLRPDIVNISMLSPRRGTPASRLKQIHGPIIKQRSRLLTQVVHKITTELNKQYVGKVYDVLVTAPGKKGGFLGRLPNYKPVWLPTAKIGAFVRAKIRSSTTGYLIGECVE